MGPPSTAEAAEAAAAEEGKGASRVGEMKRELSVEDLFAPLNRLDVCHPSSSSSSSSSSSCAQQLNESRVAHIPLSESRVAQSRASLCDPHPIQPADPHHGLSSSSAARRESTFILDMAPIPEESGLLCHTPKLNMPALDATLDHTSEDGTSSGLGMVASNNKGYTPMLKGSSTMDKVNASVSDCVGLQIQGNSTSDEDQQLVDDRKQRRMLSNRESARRSRLRKQQHLDELRGHVAQLQAQNSQMLNSFNLASQQFAQITEENQKLRSEAMSLSHQLQRLHHIVTSQRGNNGLRHSADARQMVQGPQY